MLTGQTIIDPGGPGKLTLTATEPAVTITGSLSVTEEPDTLTAAGTVIAAGDRNQTISPGLAESLLIIFARATRTKDIDALAGDLEERFNRDCASGRSRRRAARRYWAHVVRSIGPQMCQAFRRLGWLGLIAAFLRR
jgi:hypothetical protein